MKTLLSYSHLHAFSRALSVFLLGLFLVPHHALAQGKKGPELSKEQIAQMRQLFASMDAQLVPALKGQEALKQAMQNDLKALSAIKDDAEKRKAIGTYQAKYAKNYQLILRKAALDLNAVAGKLGSFIPAYQFRAQPNFTILAKLKQAFADPAPPGPKTTTTEIKSSDYADRKDLSCGALAGSSVTFTDSSVTNSVLAAEVGGCSNEGDKSVKVTRPSGALSARLDAEAKLSVEGFAVGVLGAAGATAFAEVFISGGSDFNGEFVSILVLAPFLWAGSAEESLDPARIGLNLGAGTEYTLRAHTRTTAVAGGVVAETHAKAKVSGLEASLTVEQ